MKPTHPLAAVWDCCLIVAAILVAFGSHDRRAFVVLSVLFAVTLAARLVARTVLDDPLDVEDTQQGNMVIDPWEYQRQLMHISDQYMPRQPSFTKESLLYAALVMEETAETYLGLRNIAARIRGKWLMASAPNEHQNALTRAASCLSNMAHANHDASTYLRDVIAELPSFREALAEAEAIELLDGTTDVAVVNCGLALASGLPGAEAYEEVGSSNLSKVNPITQKIDKTADGKWIKGTNFFKPDLARVLSEHAR